MSSFRGAVAVTPPPWLDFTALSPSDYLGLVLLGVVVGIPVVLFVYVVVASFVGAGDHRDVGKVLPLLNLTVLVIAYAFYSADQSRTLGEALQDMVSAELAELLPSVAATEAILLCLFWLLFATIMQLSRRLVLAPIEAMLSMVASGACCVLFTVLWMDLTNATSVPEAVLTVAGMCLLWLVWGGIAVLDDSNPFTLLARAAARDTLRALREPTDDREDLPPRPPPPPPRPHVSIRTYLRRTAITAVSSLVLATLITAAIASGDFPPPSVEDVVRVELVVFAVAFVGWCLMLRSNSSALPGVPMGMAGFTNLSLALSAALIAATGVTASPVTLGPVPPLLVAVLPGVITAAAVLLVDVRSHRRSTRAFGICLAASLIIGVLGPVVKPAVSAVTDAAFTALSLP